MTQTPNSDPGQRLSTVELSQPQLQMLGQFSADLRTVGHYCPPEAGEAYYQGAVDSICEGGIGSAYASRDEGSAGLKLAFVAEAMGAVTDDSKLYGLFDMLNASPLSDDETWANLQQLAASANMARGNGATPHDIASMLSAQADGIYDVIGRAEQQGINKDPLKLAVQAFFAGATLRVPEAGGLDRLMQTASELAAKPAAS